MAASGMGSAESPRRRRRRLLAFGLAGAALGSVAFFLQAPPRGGPVGAPSTPATTGTAPEPQLEPQPEPAPAPAGAALYRWRDSRGGIHLTSQPPPPGVAGEVIPIVGSGSAPPVAAPGRAPAGAPPMSTPSSAADRPGNPLEVYTPQGFQELMERLGDTRRQMEERDRLLDRLQRDLRP